MKLDPDRSAFGRHETFPLRFGWLSKGVGALLEESKALDLPNAPVRLGVGKNMVSAIKFWLRATGVVEKTPAGNFQLTPFGDRFFGEAGADPYLEDEATIWLLHWRLATNAQLATGIYWFFNQFHKPQFSAGEVTTALKDWAKAELRTKPAASTLKSDAALVLRMYAPTQPSKRIPLEEALDSPLALLGLVRRQTDGKQFESYPARRDELPDVVLAYAIADLFGAGGLKQLSLTDLMYSSNQRCAPGAVFRLSEQGLTAAVERLVELYQGELRLSDTSGVYQLYREESFTTRSVLDEYLAPDQRGQAA